MIRRLLLALLLGLGTASPAAAWWDFGHRVLATVADREVTPATRAAIRRLLAEARRVETPACPLATIEDASVWADCIKPLGDRFSYAYSWHYQNIDVCEPYTLDGNCPDGNCVSAQVSRATRMLADRALPVRERVEALAFLVHFVGDLHMPLHAGDRSDRGGNDLKAAYGAIAGRSNFHTIWDGYLAERAISTPPAGAAGLLAEVPPAERSALAAGSVDDWSRESWQLARDAYRRLLGGDGCGPVPAERPVMSPALAAAEVPVLRRQLVTGGLRLARLLDETLGGEPPAPGSPLLERRRRG